MVDGAAGRRMAAAPDDDVSVCDVGYSFIFGLIRVVHCALRSAGSIFFCQGSDDYQCLWPEAFARFVLGFSMSIAWPAVADGVA